MKTTTLFGGIILATGLGLGAALAQSLSPIEQLGKAIFFDPNLSTPPGQSCAACHAPQTGWTGPDAAINAGGAVYPGAIHVRFGNRKPPASAYIGNSPPLQLQGDEFVGGMFWDGRATGWRTGDPVQEQALGPFLASVEQNMPSPYQVIVKIRHAPYAGLFRQVWGPNSLGTGKKDVEAIYDRIGHSIAAYERSREVNPFSSKYDYYLYQKRLGIPDEETVLTPQELAGLVEFREYCAACHTSDPGPNGEPPLFTDFSYHNIGIPRNPQNPFYTMPPKWNPQGQAWVDLGLAEFLLTTPYAPLAPAHAGKFKTPTLRNVDKRPYPGFVKAYGHNGFFKSLEQIVHFYNTRDVPGKWPPPEVPFNVNRDLLEGVPLGNLGLSAEDEAAIVAFLKTLTDGYVPPAATAK
ncbi:MAG: cytochrome C [Verrucomicrobiae bacterium]|nr:cytochrome C [Verrucomicrobiae bacterium]